MAKRRILKPITLRNLPEPVARAVREHAAKYHVSLNKAVAQLLEASVRSAPREPGRVYHDLDKYFGTWTREEADEFDRNLAAMRNIDPADWA